jgi:hypothetical protein
MSDFAEMRRYVEDRIGRGLDVPELDAKEVKALLDLVEKLEHKCEAMARFISVCRTRKRNYLKVVKWYLANTNSQPGDMPEQILITVRNVVDAMIGKAKRDAQREKSNEV